MNFFITLCVALDSIIHPKTKKPERQTPFGLFVSSLLGLRRANRANVCAVTAVDALVGIDHVDRALADCFGGALGRASAASDALVRNFICHAKFLHVQIS